MDKRRYPYMGIFMDIIESNREFHGRRFDDHDGYYTPNLRKKPLIIQCPFCNANSTTEVELQNHIFDSHRHHQVYIKANDKVIETEAYINEKINSIEVYYFGSNFVNGTWKCGKDKGSFAVQQNGSIDIYPLIKYHSENKIEITLKSTLNSVTFDIYELVNPTINYQELDKIFYQFQEAYLSQFDQYDWTNFKEEIHFKRSNPIEAHYLEGLFEYLYGVELEQQLDSRNSYGHLERSFSIMRKFPTDLAHTVRTTIAFKLKWYELLNNLPVHSFYYLTSQFIYKSYADLEKIEALDKDVELDQTVGIYVDDYTFIYMKAILAYLKSDMLSLEQLVIKLSDHPMRKLSSINEEKYRLLMTRYHRRKGSIKLAKIEFSFLQEYGDYESEMEGL